MSARFRIDFFELIVETTCGVCGLSFMAFPDIDDFEYKCDKCDQVYRVNFTIAPVSKIDIIKREIKRNMMPNPPFNSED